MVVTRLFHISNCSAKLEILERLLEISCQKWFSRIQKRNNYIVSPVAFEKRSICVVLTPPHKHTSASLRVSSSVLIVSAYLSMNLVHHKCPNNKRLLVFFLLFGNYIEMLMAKEKEITSRRRRMKRLGASECEYHYIDGETILCVSVMRCLYTENMP